MSSLTYEAVAGYVYATGLRGEAAAIAVAISTPESTRDPSKHNLNPATGDDSWGLFQINMIGDLGPARRARYGITSNAELLDPTVNSNAMYVESGGGGNWRPWSTYKAGKHTQYLPDARAAVAAVEARGGNPSSGAPVATGTTVDLGRSGDISWGLPAGIDPTVTYAHSSLWGPGFFIRGQSVLRTLLSDTMTGGSIELAIDAVAEMTLEVGAGFYGLDAVSDELAIGADVDWWDLILKIVGGEWSEGDQSSYLFTARCRAAGPEEMRERTGNIERAWARMSPTEVLAERAAEAGLRFVGEGSNRRDTIIRKGPADGVAQMPTSSSSDTESDWDLGQRLAREEGYWFFESAGTLFFARPSWLLDRMPRFAVDGWNGSVLGVDDVDRVNNGTIGIPQARRAKDDDLPPGHPPRTISFKLPRERGEQVRPGMVCDFKGLPLFADAYLVSHVSFPFDGGLEPATVELVDATDPVPEPPPEVLASEAAAEAAAQAATGGGAQVTGGIGSALDMVTIALRQVGDEYVYGAETSGDDPDPTAFDCSELIQWACARVGVDFTDQSEAQMAAVEAAGLPNPPHGLAVADCVNIRGALLWHPGHVAISLGDGVHTVEAMGRKYGVVQGNIGARFNKGGLIPGLDYGTTSSGSGKGASNRVPA